VLAAAGLGCAVIGGVWGGLAHGAFLKGVWPFIVIDAEGDKSGPPFGSIMLFDFGVYLVVLGTVTGILFALEDSLAEDLDPDEDAGDPRWK
jgi:multicomponent Na+:H+ antiporter subunit B